MGGWMDVTRNRDVTRNSPSERLEEQCGDLQWCRNNFSRLSSRELLEGGFFGLWVSDSGDFVTVSFPRS